MKRIFIILLATILAVGCGQNRSFNANILGVDKINIEGAKALVSLENSSATRGGSGETILYAIDEDNKVILPKISCTFLFDEEMSEQERQDIIEKMQATINTDRIYDLGPYVIIKYHLSYTSSIETNNGKTHATANLGFIYSAIRKSDGKAFRVNHDQQIHWMLDCLDGFNILKNYLRISESETCLIYGNNGAESGYIVKIIEQGDVANIEFEDVNVTCELLKDQHGNVYISRGGQIETYEGFEVRPESGDSLQYAIQVGDKVYAFRLTDGIELYSILDGRCQFESILSGDKTGSPSFIGSVNGKIVWYSWSSGHVVQFNPASRVYQSKELGEETKKLITQSQSLIIDQFAYCVCRNVRKVDFVKINLLDESMETTPIYDGEHLIHFYLTGSKVDNYLHLCSERYFGESIFYSVYSMANLPDLSDYIIDKVIPLK